MVDEIDLNAFVSSPYASDIKKQQQAYMSAKNIRKINESVEEYKARMAQFREQQEQKLIAENTDILQKRLENLDISNIATKNRLAIESLIREAQSIKYFAYNNMYKTKDIDLSTLDKAILAAQARLNNIKTGKEDSSIGTGIYADTYRTATKASDSILNKLLNNNSKE